MAQAFPLGTKHYLQFLRVSRDAPRREPSWTTELDGKQRFGRGQTNRLFGPYALVVGSWTTQTPDDVIEESLAGLGADLRPDQFEELRARFSGHNIERLETGWVAPWWHHQHWLRRVLPLLVRTGLATTPAYGVVHWTKPWKRSKSDWQPMASPKHYDWDRAEPRVEP